MWTHGRGCPFSPAMLHTRGNLVLRVSSIASTRRYVASGRSPPPPPGGALEADPQASWVMGHTAKAVAKGRMTEKSAAYFQTILGQFPEMREVVKVAKDQVGDQDPEKFSAFQQRMYGEAVSRKASEVAAKSLGKALKEQDDLREINEGRPTGENYWMESGAGLHSVDVPPTVKQDIFDAMRQDRPKDSPAFGIQDSNQGSQRAADALLGGDMIAAHQRGDAPRPPRRMSIPKAPE
jgi:hypothetical protein